jgi:hypothetical protein
VPREHVAIIDRRYLLPLLSGAKVVETRLSRTRRLPFGRVLAGDRVHFKCSGGGLIGTCNILAVQHLARMTPARVDRLRRRLGRHVVAPAAYWRRRRMCRYAVVIWLDRLERPPRLPPVPRQYGGAWIMLDESPGRVAPPPIGRGAAPIRTRPATGVEWER